MPTAPGSAASLDFEPAAPLHPSPADWRDQSVYFLLVDRFDDHRVDPPAHHPGASAGELDPRQGGIFQGGTLKGIERRLDYIQGLGVTTVWLSPIFKNRLASPDSYHGYGIQDFLEVDPRFGSLEDLQSLTAAAHARGMYVILDIIFNHAGDVWGYPGDHSYYYWQGQRFPFGFWRRAAGGQGAELGRDDAVWPRELQGPENFKRQGRIRNWNDDLEARDGDFESLKELELRSPVVLDTLIKAYKYWIAAADVDGFRIDTVKHMEHSAVAIFCNAMREYAQRVGKHNFFLFGEIVDDDATIQRYLGRNARIEGSRERLPALDAALDFPLYFALEEVIKGFADPAALRARYEVFREFYSDHGAAGRYFVTFVDNHDQMARPYRRFMHGNRHPAQAVLAVGYLLTSQGIPCIYYGTEQGLDGGGSNDDRVRECMFGGTWGAFGSTGHHCFDPESPIYRGIHAIAELRKRIPALRYGRQYFREISGNGRDFGHPQGGGRCTLAWSRILDTSEIVVAQNLEAAPRRDCITVDANLSPGGTKLRDLLGSGEEAEVQVADEGRCFVRLDLPAHGMVILERAD